MWINFFTITFAVVAAFLVFGLYKVYPLMKYQDAGTPWPPTTPKCPDGWVLDTAGWCVIPGVVSGCGSGAGGAGGVKPAEVWQTTGSLPSAWIRRPTCTSSSSSSNNNVGTLHTDDATYARLLSLVPAVHKPAAVPGTFTSSDIVPQDFRDGKVAIHFADAPIEVRRKFCATYGIFWDGVYVAEQSTQ